MRKKHPNIKSRLVYGSFILIIFPLLVSIFYMNDVQKLNRTIDEIIKHPYTVSNSVRDINININAMHRSMKDVALASNETQLNEAIALVESHEKIIYEKFEIVSDRFLGSQDIVIAAFDEFVNWKPIRDEVIELVKKNESEKAAEITKAKGALHVKSLIKKINTMIAFADNKANEYNTSSFHVQEAAIRKASIFIISSLILSFVSFIWIIRGVNRPLEKIINKIKKIPSDQFINKFPENEKNKLALLDFVFIELEDQKKLLESQVSERTKELKESQEILGHAINNATLGIVQVGLNGKYINTNKAFCNMVGYSEKELTKLAFNDITLEEDKQIGVEFTDKMLKGNSKKSNYEKRYIHKSGRVIHCSITSSLVNDLNNNPLYFFTQIKDITDQKKYELELIENKSQLEELIKKRTFEIEIKAKKLEDSQKALVYLVEDVNESREEMQLLNDQINVTNKELEAFSYSVSHDLRAPLRAIDGFTNILFEDYASKLDDEAKRVGAVIKFNAKKMGQLIDDLLSFSRSGRAAMSFSKIDMKNMANAIYHEATLLENRNRIHFTLEDLPEIKGDTTLMRQVWMNLISNAVKFTSHREKAIISVTSEQSDNEIIYCIKDNGAGFNMKYKDKLFGVFQRLHSEKEFSGTGVGLALAQRILGRHGGDIWAESEVGKGASFFFSFPKKRKTK